ncbi:MAG: cytochrome c biogenesis heme-transporting ATPase CcmA [Rubrivivax sp.]|jgi:heme exporter protein A
MSEFPQTAVRPLLLSVRGLACRRGERLLFEGLDFGLGEGDVVWLRGRNGRGKTSLLRVLAALSPPSEGEVRFAGEPLSTARALAGAGTLFLAHANALKDDLSAAEALAFLARLHGQHDDAESIEQALRRLGVHGRRNAAVRTLSQGQRRRVALARLALAPAKGLWLLDEPYDALDVEGCAIVDGLLHDHVQQGGAVLLTSHLPLSDGAPRWRELVLPEPVSRRAAPAPRGLS